MKSQSSSKNFVMIAFLVFGVTALYGQVFYNLYLDWLKDENYSHGFLVPAISGYFIWQQRSELKKLEVNPSNYGIVLIVFAFLVLFLGVAAQEFFTRRSSFVFLAAGIVLFLLGWQWLRSLALPIAYLFFMIPIPYIIYDAIAFPLKLFVAKFSVILLKILNVVVSREGNIIMFPEIVLEVADACSGLRSLMSLLALAVALSVFTQKKISQRMLLVLLAVPIAVVTNMSRVVGTGILAQNYGASAAEGFFHEFAGMAVFILAMILLFACSGIVKKVWP